MSLLQRVIVDDTDPAITYGPTDGWNNVSNSNSDLTPLPQYGTLHDSKFDVPVSFTFTFTGVSITVFFYNTDISDIGSCTLDGQEIMFQLSGAPPRAQCTASLGVVNEVHQFIFAADGGTESETVQFDYIEYDSNGGDTPNVDMAYFSNDSSIEIRSRDNIPDTLLSAGDTLDFTFMGYSLGVYSTFNLVTHNPSPASYSIDGGAAVNFTITPPLGGGGANQTGQVSGVLIVQTARYPLGQHHFHLDFWGGQDSAPLKLFQIIVQNTTSPSVLLNTIPPTVSPNSSSTVPLTVSIIPSSTTTLSSTTIPSSTKLGPIIGGATAGAFMLILVIFLTFFICKRRRVSASIIETDDLRDSYPVIESSHECYTPSRSLRQNTTHQSRHTGSNYDTDQSRIVEPNVGAPLGRQRALEYRVHEDSGEQITQLHGGAVAVDLPPIYDTIGFPTPPALQANHRQMAITWHEGGNVGVEEESNVVNAALPSPITRESLVTTEREARQRRRGDMVEVLCDVVKPD